MAARVTYLAEAFGLSMLFKTKRGEVYTLSEDLRLSKNANTTNTVDLHFHVRVAVRIAEVGQMRSPGSVLCVTFDNNSVFVKGVRQSQSCLRLLPRIKIVRLLST